MRDIVAKCTPLPTQVAQQILDVIQARIQGGASIRTNPAAVLRGIVQVPRRSRQLRSLVGFHIADQRRQRAEAEARLRRAAEVQRIESAKRAVAHPRCAPRQRLEATAGSWRPR